VRVFLDATAAAKARKTGIGHYVSRLATAMLAVDPALRLTLGVRTGLGRRPGQVLMDDVPGGDRARRRWFWTRMPGLATRGADVAHGPDARLVGGSRPQVVTFHDLFNVKGEAWGSAEFRARKRDRYAEAVARADRILCVSHATAREVEERLKVDRARIVVTPLGVDGRFRPVEREAGTATLGRLGIRAPYLLFVGLAQPRKNLETIATVFGRIAARDDSLSLVLAGEDGYPEGRLDAILKETGATDRVHRIGYVDPADLPALYSAAACLLFPSRDEGFGLPVIEAMACGCPVVASDAGALREVVGEGGLVARPDATVELEEMVTRMLEDEDARRAQVERGRVHAAAFTWARTARATLEAYRAAAGG
jgi:glycosyltransferase involved in cell wall biosynthesis